MAQRRIVPADHSLVTAYIRVSTAEQADSGLGLAAQRASIAAECERRGWTLVAVHEDAGLSGKSMKRRPGLDAAIADLETAVAGTLMVTKLDRLSRSMADYATLVEKAIDRKWNLAVIDLNADLSTPSGELMGTMTAAFARQERRLISQRTKDALAVLKAQGVTLGRPVVLPQAVADRIVASRNAGMGWSAIARELNDEHVPTATHKGTTWHPSAVQKVALRQGAK